MHENGIETQEHDKSVEIIAHDDHCSRCGRLLKWLQWESDYEFDERGWWDCENENCPDSIFYME